VGDKLARNPTTSTQPGRQMKKKWETNEKKWETHERMWETSPRLGDK